MHFGVFGHHGNLLVFFGSWFLVCRVSNFVRRYSGSGLECPSSSAQTNYHSAKHRWSQCRKNYCIGNKRAYYGTSRSQQITKGAQVKGQQMVWVVFYCKYSETKKQEDKSSEFTLIYFRVLRVASFPANNESVKECAEYIHGPSKFEASPQMEMAARAACPVWQQVLAKRKCVLLSN